MNKLTKLLSVFVIAGAVGTGVSFAAGCVHKHSFSEDWTPGEETHWHAATCEHSEEKADEAAHKDENNNFLCDDCGYDMATHVTEVTLDTNAKTLKIGEEYTLVATVLPSNASIGTYSWKSSNTDVAEVANGKVTAKAAGEAVITVTTTDGAKTDTCTITVESETSETVAVTGITLDKSTLDLNEGETGTLVATVAPENATNKNFTFTSSDPTVASVEGNVVTAVKEGTATITVTTEDGNYTATCTVTVNPATVAVTGVTLNKTEVSLKVGASTTIKATIAPANATNKNRTRVSSDTSVATIDENGTIKAVGVGTAVITVKTEDGGFEATCTVTVNPATIAVESVAFEHETLELEVEDTHDIHVKIAPATATNKDYDVVSSDPEVVSIDGDVFVANKVGTATITVTTKDGAKTATCSITVKERTSEKVAVTGISLDKTSVTIKVGDTEQITATVAPANASNKTRDRVSSNPEVATIDSDGTITALKAGTATITVTTRDGGFKATCEVTVIPATIEVTGVTLDTDTLNLKVGATHEFEATITPDDADNQTVRYTSSDETVAKMVGSRLTALKAGTAVITVTTEDGNYTATCTVTVAPATVIISFNMNGHGAAIANATATDGKITAPAAPTAEGWSFGGWYESEACMGEAIDFTTKTFTASTTIFAKWVQEYSISFDLNGHGGETAPESVYTVAGKITAPAAPEDEEYDFMGWALSADGTTAVDFTTKVFEANTPLYAIWQKKPTVVYNNDYRTDTEVQAGTENFPTAGGVYSYIKYNKEVANADNAVTITDGSIVLTDTTSDVTTYAYLRLDEAISLKKVTVEAQFTHTDGSTAGSWTFMTLCDGAGNEIFALRTNGSKNVALFKGNNALNDKSCGYTAKKAMAIKAVLDLVNGTATVTVDGKDLGTVEIEATTFAGISMMTAGGSRNSKLDSFVVKTLDASVAEIKAALLKRLEDKNTALAETHTNNAALVKTIYDKAVEDITAGETEAAVTATYNKAVADLDDVLSDADMSMTDTNSLKNKTAAAAQTYGEGKGFAINTVVIGTETVKGNLDSFNAMVGANGTEAAALISIQTKSDLTAWEEAVKAKVYALPTNDALLATIKSKAITYIQNYRKADVEALDHNDIEYNSIQAMIRPADDEADPAVEAGTTIKAINALTATFKTVKVGEVTKLDVLDKAEKSIDDFIHDANLTLAEKQERYAGPQTSNDNYGSLGTYYETKSAVIQQSDIPAAIKSGYISNMESVVTAGKTAIWAVTEANEADLKGVYDAQIAAIDLIMAKFDAYCAVYAKAEEAKQSVIDDTNQAAIDTIVSTFKTALDAATAEEDETVEEETVKGINSLKADVLNAIDAKVEEVTSQTFNVTFTGVATPAQVGYAGTAEAPTSGVPTYADKLIVGWTETENGDTAFDFTTKLTADLTLYPIFVNADVSITLKVGNETYKTLYTYSSAVTNEYAGITIPTLVLPEVDSENKDLMFSHWYETDQAVAYTLPESFEPDATVTLNVAFKGAVPAHDDCTWAYATDGKTLPEKIDGTGLTENSSKGCMELAPSSAGVFITLRGSDEENYIRVKAKSTSGSNWSTIAVKDEDGNYIEIVEAVTGNVKKHSDKNLYAVKSENVSTLTFKTVKAGKYTIIAESTTAENGGGLGEISRSVRITAIDVKDTYKVPLVAVSNVEVALKEGEWTENKTYDVTASSIELKATVRPDNASYLNVTWTSSDETVATVENGVVTFIKKGTVTITATAHNGVGDNVTITITDTALEAKITAAKNKLGQDFPADDYALTEWNGETIGNKTAYEQAYQTAVAAIEAATTEDELDEAVATAEETLGAITKTEDLKKTQYNVKFYNGTTEYTTLATTVAEGYKVAKPDDPDAETGYRFKGWYTDETFTTEFLFGQEATGVSAHLNLYAKFVRLYTVTFDANGGSTVEEQIVESGDYATEPTSTKDGYVFVGWIAEGATAAFDFDNTAITGDTAFTAQWRLAPVEYFVPKTETPIEDGKLTIDNLLFTASSADGVTIAYKNQSESKKINVTGAVKGDNKTKTFKAGVDVTNNFTSEAPSPSFTFTAKEDITLYGYFAISDSNGTGNRKGDMFYKLNNGAAVVIVSEQSKAKVVYGMLKVNVKKNDVVEVFGANVDQGARLWFFGAEAEYHETDVQVIYHGAEGETLVYNMNSGDTLTKTTYVPEFGCDYDFDKWTGTEGGTEEFTFGNAVSAGEINIYPVTKKTALKINKDAALAALQEKYDSNNYTNDDLYEEDDVTLKQESNKTQYETAMGSAEENILAATTQAELDEAVTEAEDALSKIITDEFFGKTIYTVTFVGGEGVTNVPDAVDVGEGGKVSKPTTDPVKAGYTFKYWQKAGTSVEFNFANTEISEATTLNAVFVKNYTESQAVSTPVTIDNSTAFEGENSSGKYDKASYDFLTLEKGTSTNQVTITSSKFSIYENNTATVKVTGENAVMTITYTSVSDDRYFKITDEAGNPVGAGTAKGKNHAQTAGEYEAKVGINASGKTSSKTIVIALAKGTYTLKFIGGEHKIGTWNLTEDRMTNVDYAVNSVTATAADGITTATELNKLVNVSVNVTENETTVAKAIDSGYTVSVKDGGELAVGENTLVIIYGDGPANEFNSVEVTVTLSE